MSTSIVNVISDGYSNSPVRLSRELRSGEYYCHQCDVFVLFKNRELHVKYHRQRIGGVAPKQTGIKLEDKVLDSPKVKEALANQGQYLNTPTKLLIPVTSLLDLGDGPPCTVCGSIMVRNGSCYVCKDCGTTSSCS